MHVIAAKFPLRSRPRRWWKQPNCFFSAEDAAANSWQAKVSPTLTQRNEGSQRWASLGTSTPISPSDWCVPVKWSGALSDMTRVSLWHTCSRLTLIGVDGAHSTHAARRSYFDPLFFYFCPPLPCFLSPCHIRSERGDEGSDPQVLAHRAWGVGMRWK